MNKIYTYYYFIGVGGIGMSALARFFLAMGKEVYGYDKTPSPLTDQLQAEGIQVTFQDEVSELVEGLRDKKDQLMVVYTPAIPEQNKLFNYFSSLGCDLFKRAQVLGMITWDSINLSVAGTHGKTTTSCMLASIFKQSNKRFSAFLGGISADLGSNFYHQEGEGSLYTITEADEYDRSFLQLDPSMAIITSTDSDHLDIYGEADEVFASFKAFSDKVLDRELLLLAKNKTAHLNGWNYSATDDTADYFAEIHESSSTGSRFTIWHAGKPFFKDLHLNLAGVHNTENATGAAVLALKAGVDPAAIRHALAQFKGIKRRFEYLIDRPDLVYIDDYAHHPSELDSIIGSVRKLYPNKRITGIFQPHLYSRTRDFMDGFAQSLSALDELILLPIYPARELPIAGVHSEALFQKVTLNNKRMMERDALVAQLNASDLEVVLTLGAGDIDRIVEPLKEKLNA